ncbi:hypothetical protein PV327_008020 [Microctonus hyperodae]|uniref:Uncharacterized protein n=1 Tax=Microctonus hyperodae TaxID=165561 RepID=A0AA39G0E6_MICHY|nr:hypothetical protein PV327_008020 [Microctonus hyperodae]
MSRILNIIELSSQYSHAALLRKLSNFEDINSFDESADSSLGLVNNISSILQDHEQSIEESNIMIVNKIETERQLARQLLQKCGNETNNKSSSSSILDINKENDVNAQNLSLSRLTQTPKLPMTTSKLSMNSVTFEPNEFTARSSEMSKSTSDLDEAKSISQSKCDINGFSFNSTAAELMAKFADDDFISGSRISNQLDADEMSCRQNFNSIPIPTENERLEFSCFSGIMGDIDLTIDSRAGHKVSVGEYFSRKCGTLGQLSDVISNDRPNFGLIGIKSPERKNKPQPLVNITSTLVNDQSSTCIIDDKNKTVTNDDRNYDNDDDCTIMSLSKIAQALQTTDGTPRRLVDQLLRTKTKPGTNPKINSTSNTYTILTTRASMPDINTSSSSTSSSSLLLLNTSENNHKLLTKFSLDSKKSTNSINDNKYKKNDFPYCNEKNNSINSIKVELQKNQNEIKTDMSLSPLLLKQMSQVLKTSSYTKDKLLINNYDEIRQEEKSIISLSRFDGKIIIGKNTQELYECIIGVIRIINIEIRNESECWLICKLELQQIQGDESNVKIDVPKNEILLEPRKSSNVKITVNLLKTGDPIMASLAIDVTDMSTHETITKQHMMCFVPQELKNEESSILSDVDVCEIRIIDTQMPIILKKNEIKCLKIKNTSKETVTLSLTIVQNDNVRKFALSLEPRKIILNSNGICEINVQYQGIINDNNAASNIISTNNDANNDGQVSIKIKISNKIYLYPIIIKMDSTTEENAIDYLRCNTPKQYSTLSNWGNVSPSSPHSISSLKSGRNSPLSTASGLTVSGDTIPIKSTNSSLIWTSVRVGKHETREFTIRNISNNKIKLQAIITDNENSFKFLKDRDMSTTITVGLQHMESKTFTVIFSPNNIGAVAGRITFMHYDCKRDGKEPRSPKIIPLYGYGGYAKVSISQALKIMGDQMWLSLGKLNLTGILNSRIKLENSGDLAAYAKITLAPKAVYPSVETSWHIEPTELILGPKEIHWITVKFRPRKEDLVLVRGDVADMGTLTITHGDEPTRWRIRRLYKKLCESGQLLRRPDQDDIFSNVVYPICKIFPGELPMHNLNIIRDSPQDLGTLCRGVNRHVVTLTIELNSDDTIPIFHDDYDDTNESQMFQSLRSDVTTICFSNNNSYMPLDSTMAVESNSIQNINQHIYPSEFTVSPTAITLTPPLIYETTVMIKSSSTAAQPFETKLSHGQYINVIPSEGMVPAGRGVILKIQCQKNISNNINDLLEIYTTNQQRAIKITIIPKRH